MVVLKQVKLAALKAGTAAGLSRWLFDSHWRQQRLLILCYHGISLDDEHEWDPSLFMPAALLQRRLELLGTHGCAVLPLPEALARLERGDLPPRSVALTFDDGTYDFLVRALPVVKAFGFPATLYFSTFYSHFNRPVYDLAVSYVLWKARGRRFDLPGVLPGPVTLDAAGIDATTARLRAHAHVHDLSAEEKDALLTRIAAAGGIDLAPLRARRILHLLTPDEVALVQRQGVDVQLHTHRHRVYDERSRFDRGIDENRRSLDGIVPGPLEHFCYPGGVHLPEFLPWLAQNGVRSAATCQPGLVSRATHPLLLPRLVDTSTLTSLEFTSWLSGLAAFLPHRRPHHPEWMLVRASGMPAHG